jgi:hypothetical protein
MANSTTNLDTISSGQASKEITANALFDAMSASALGGRRASTTAALTWGYYGGQFQKADLSIVTVANGTIALTASTTNYIYMSATGVVTKTTTAPTGWPGPITSPADAIALYAVVTDGSGVTSYTDYRAPLRGPAGPAGASGGATLTAKGDIGTFDTGNVRLAVGTDGQVLTADSAQPKGIKWSSPPFDVHAFAPGVLTASQKMLRVPVARAVAFPANFAGSYGKASAASTGTAVIDVQKNGVSIGSITFTASATATFATSSGAAQSLAAGDVLSFIAPGSADATLADVGIVLSGTR